MPRQLMSNRQRYNRLSAEDKLAADMRIERYNEIMEERGLPYANIDHALQPTTTPGIFFDLITAEQIDLKNV